MGVMFSAVLICLFVFLFVCLSVSSIAQSYEWIVMKFYGGVWDGKRNKWLHFGSDSDHHVASPTQPLLNKLWADFDEIFRIAVQWYNEQLIKF